VYPVKTGHEKQGRENRGQTERSRAGKLVHNAEMESNQDPASRFFEAIQKGDAEQVRALLAATPDLAVSTHSSGASPALWAVYTGHRDLASLVLASRDPDFFEACALGHSARATELASRDAALLNAYSQDGFTGLGLAVFFNHPKTARLLIESGASVDAASRNALAVAPLHSAVASGNPELVELLLDRGAAPDPADASGLTPLHSAAAHGNREMARRLLAAGAALRRQTKEGKTPADLAAQYGHPELARELSSPARIVSAPGGQ